MHPETKLTGYVTETLPPAERARVAAHLDACADCRRAVEESRTVLAELAAGVPSPPPIDWGRYRADLRARVQAGPRRAYPRRAWWARPMPAVLAAGVATAVALLAIHGLDRRPGELAAVEETMLGARLPLLQQYRVVERLDLLEDLEAIRHLDRLGAGGR
jgi:anti-sigma-K factor RskA